jgi:hypothetical protein
MADSIEVIFARSATPTIRRDALRTKMVRGAYIQRTPADRLTLEDVLKRYLVERYADLRS